MRNPLVRRITLAGLLFALSMGLSIMESTIAPFLGLPPGVKPGLANVVVMVALLLLGRRYALLLVLLKAGFNALTRGLVAGGLSLCGGLFSLCVMLLLLLPALKASMVLVSVGGAISHNLAQLLAIRLLLGTSVLVFLPMLLISGVVMGSLTAGLLRALLPQLKKLGLGAPTFKNTRNTKSRKEKP